MSCLANDAAPLKIGFCALLLFLVVGALVSATDTRAQTQTFYDGSTAAQLTATRDTSVAAAHTPTPTTRRTATASLSPTAEPTHTASVTPTASTTATPTPTPSPTETPTPTSTFTPTPTSTATPLYCPTPTPGPPPEGEAPTDGSDCPITVSVRTGEDRYWISTQATMPTDVSAFIRVTGLPAEAIRALEFTWTIAVTYVGADFDGDFGSVENIAYQWPSQTTSGFQSLDVQFGDVVRGGTLVLTASTSIGEQPYTARALVPILGRNPSSNELQAYFSSQFPSSYYTLWRIAQAESNLRHFTEDGYPKWSSDGFRGVGLMQITNPAPTPDEVWSWKRNADAGSRVLQGGYAIARDWPRTVAASSEFQSAIRAYDAARENAGLSKLQRVTVPDFTSGNFACNLLQRELDAVRLYNGAGGTDDLGRPLHEYKLAYDRTLGLLELDVDEENGTGTARWVRVPASERPARGAANYVEIVLSKPAPGRC
jgi:hypothetical protein